MIDISARARALGIGTNFKDLREAGASSLPQRIAILAQGASDSVYSTDKRQITSAPEGGRIYGWGSPIHLIARQLFPANGDGAGTIPVTVYPLKDAESAQAAQGSIAPTGTQSKSAVYRVRVSNITSQPFLVQAGASVADICTSMAAAINAVLEMPVKAAATATEVELEAKWAGETGNDIVVEVLGEELGVTYAITQPTGGLLNPQVDDALAQIGNVWETLIINALGPGDSDTLDALQTLGEARWGELVRRPFVAFCGTTEEDVATAIAVPSGRRDDRVNVQLVAPGSKDLPFAVAARQVVRIAQIANANPPVNYAKESVDGITPGPDGAQWDYAQRDMAVKAGCSTVEVEGGELRISDVVTFYHPEGEQDPAYRYVVDVIKLMNIIYNVDLVFDRKEWAQAVLVPDHQPEVTNPRVRRPRDAVAALGSIIDGLAGTAIIADPEAAKESTQAVIDSSNPKRLNIAFVVRLSGNANIVDVQLNFGFYYGA